MSSINKIIPLSIALVRFAGSSPDALTNGTEKYLGYYTYVHTVLAQLYFDRLLNTNRTLGKVG